MSLSSSKVPAAALPLRPLSSAIGRGLMVGVTATLVQVLLLALLLDLCGVVAIL